MGWDSKVCPSHNEFLGSSLFSTVIPRVRETPVCLRPVVLRATPSFLSLEVGRPFARKTPSKKTPGGYNLASFFRPGVILGTSGLEKSSLGNKSDNGFFLLRKRFEI